MAANSIIPLINDVSRQSSKETHLNIFLRICVLTVRADNVRDSKHLTNNDYGT